MVVVDPQRFAELKLFRRTKGPDDYFIYIEGMLAGRIFKSKSRTRGDVWIWTLTGPSIPSVLGPHNGEAASLKEAQIQLKSKFLAWQQSAMKAGSGRWNVQNT